MYVLGANRMQYLFFSPKRILRFSIFLLHAAVQPGTQRGMGGSFLDACTWALVLHMQFLLTHTMGVGMQAGSTRFLPTSTHETVPASSVSSLMEKLASSTRSRRAARVFLSLLTTHGREKWPWGSTRGRAGRLAACRSCCLLR